MDDEDWLSDDFEGEGEDGEEGGEKEDEDDDESMEE